jgi:hypothetical protein
MRSAVPIGWPRGWASQRKSRRVRKGDLYVRRLLCEFAHAASRTQSAPRDIVAMARKILRTLYFMLKRNHRYGDSTTDYEALGVQRNVPRWIKALTRFRFTQPTTP